MKLIEKAIENASMLANKFEMPPEFIANILDGRLYYSTVIYPHGGVCVEIERDGDGAFAALVRECERRTGAYVYHCFLTGPFLTMLLVNEKANATMFQPQMTSDYIGAAVVNFDNQETFFMDVLVGKYDDVLVRLD